MSIRVAASIKRHFAAACVAAACAAAAVLMLASCERAPEPKSAQQGDLDPVVQAHLATFDELDFNVFTHQKWDRLHESHSKDIVVHWPDGHQTKGIEQHIEDLKAIFVHAPDTRIQTHPVKFGAGDWTSVIGVMEGTFTKPMPIGNGKSLAPTGKPFKIEMCTVGHWKDGVMDEEYLYWDNFTYMKQIGVLK